MATSLRSRIILTLVGALTVAGVGASWATYYSTRSELSDLFDSQLRHTALELTEKGEEKVESISLIGLSPQLNMLVQIYDASENRIYTSRHHIPLPISEVRGFSNVVTETGREWRQFTSTVGTRIIQVAQPLEVRDSLAVSTALRIVQPLLVLIPFLAIAIWFITSHMLEPLSRTARAVALRSPSSLSPLETRGLPFELKSLVDALNELLARLGDSLSAQQRFASDAAHELRTPLAAIKLQAQLLARARDDEARAKYGARLQQGVARATRLVEQLLTIARLDPDAAEKPMSDVDLAQIAGTTVEELSMSAAEKDITLSAKAEPLVIRGMPEALHLMVVNLTDNAIRYTPTGGRIEIGVAAQDGKAVITVTDNGPGIAPEERQRVFERFYRALGTKVSGTGLGLAIVSRIVQMHEGTITVEDGFEREATETVPAGCGAKFVVTLPTAHQPTLLA
ncbi:MAG: ATP-binding protein [Duodenibacillus sp.]|nr:ATP-binding protein [Duodenibacillus sp.]